MTNSGGKRPEIRRVPCSGGCGAELHAGDDDHPPFLCEWCFDRKIGAGDAAIISAADDELLIELYDKNLQRAFSARLRISDSQAAADEADKIVAYLKPEMKKRGLKL